tara:strand:- start:241 stop:465 length:225 start_codon:yes stop_codon:yes gene_type:complete
MNKGFLKYVGDNHSDPDSLIANNFVFNELCELAENYSKQQLILHGVSKSFKEEQRKPLPDVEYWMVEHGYKICD